MFNLIPPHRASVTPTGCYIIVLHDAVDYWLEGAKMAKYCRSQRLCDVLFVIFTLVWLVTRLLIYPLYPLYSVAFECRAILAPFHAWYIFFALLCILQLLHVLWFFMILRVAYNALTAGKDGHWSMVRAQEASTKFQFGVKNQNRNPNRFG